MKKSFVALTLVSLFVTLDFPFSGQAATSLDEINQQIANLKQQQKDANSKISQIDQKIDSVQSQKADAKNDLDSIDQKLNDSQTKLQNLEIQIDSTTIKAQDAAVQLDNATKRVNERDGLLKERVKVMYEIGDVSYLDVLLGAKDFSDFLDRLAAVNMIVKSDTKILEENISDKNTVEQKKKEVDSLLNNLKGLYTDASNLKEELKQQQQERSDAIAALTKQEGQLVEVKQEQQQAMLDLVDKMKAAMSEKQRLSQSSSSGSSQSNRVVYSGGRFAWPVPSSSIITSPFGYRKDPFTGQTAGHDGIDIGAPQGSDILAAADGVVLVSGYVRGYGNCIIIDHGGGLTTLYGHIREGGLMVKEGQSVKRGQKIAEVGSTGRSTGPHCHFGVINGRTPVDPMGYLR